MVLPQPHQDNKVFVGGLSWETSNDKLRAYFENFGGVREAFISVNRTNGRPRGFGFVTFESAEVARKVIAAKHTIDRREVEAKESFAKEEQSSTSQASSEGNSAKNKKLFVGGLAPAVDDDVLRQHFESFGPVESVEVMLDHDSSRPRGFGFVTFVSEESVEKVFAQGPKQSIMDKQVEIKLATPRDKMHADQMPAQQFQRGPFDHSLQGRAMMQQRNGFFTGQLPFGQYPGGGPAAGYGPRSAQLGMQGPNGMGHRGAQQGFRGAPIGPAGFGQQHAGGYGNIGHGEGISPEMYAALYQLSAGRLVPQQVPDFQGQVPGASMELHAQQFAKLALNTATSEAPAPAASNIVGHDSSLDGAQALDFYKPAAMGPGWSS